MDGKLRVWLVKEGEALPTDQGQQRLLRMGLIAEEFEKTGAEILWWASTFDHNHKTFRTNKPEELTVNDHYRIQLLHGRNYTKNLSYGRIMHYADERRLFSRMAEKKQKPDLILASMPNIDLALAAVKYGKKHHVPVFVDVRDMWPELYEEYFPKLKRVVHYAIIPFKKQLAFTLKNAAGIYATSDHFLNWALTYAGRERQSRDGVYYVSYPDTNIAIENEDMRFWYDMGLKETDLICCFFGQFGYAVNIEPVLHAALELKDKAPEIKFVICGLGEKLEGYKKIVGDAKNVLFPGWVDRRQICALSRIASVGLLAYRKNKNFEWSMPNKFCEYLAMGLGLLLEPTGMMEELAAEYNCGQRYESAHDMAEILLAWNRDREKVMGMKKRARQLYEKSFQANEVYGRMVRDLAKAAEGK